jgi:hypothetical protein
MNIDTIPTKKITAKRLECSIFTGTKYCFVNFDAQSDISWDGEKEIVEWDDKGISILFSKKELEGFRPSDSVHNFLSDLRQQRAEEIAELKKKVKTAKTHWQHSRCSGMTCNPKQMIKDRIEFLESNEIHFVEIDFVKSN